MILPKSTKCALGSKNQTSRLHASANLTWKFHFGTICGFLFQNDCIKPPCKLHTCLQVLPTLVCHSQAHSKHLCCFRVCHPWLQMIPSHFISKCGHHWYGPSSLSKWMQKLISKLVFRLLSIWWEHISFGVVCHWDRRTFLQLDGMIEKRIKII